MYGQLRQNAMGKDGVLLCIIQVWERDRYPHTIHHCGKISFSSSGLQRENISPTQEVL